MPSILDRFSCALVRGSGGSSAQPHVLFGQAYQAWDDITSPGLSRTRSLSTPVVSSPNYFAWSDTPLERMSPIGRDIRLDAAEHGLRNGFVVPVHGEDGESVRCPDDVLRTQIRSRGPQSAERHGDALFVIGVERLTHSRKRRANRLCRGARPMPRLGLKANPTGHFGNPGISQWTVRRTHQTRQVEDR